MEGELHDLGNEIGRKISPGHGGGTCDWACRRPNRKFNKTGSKKIQKGKPLSVIAEECEEDESVIQEIIASIDEEKA